MITKIRFCINHLRRFDSRTRFEELTFSQGYNVLIGSNGSGKSTILEALATCKDCDIQRTPESRILYLSAEKLNPNFNSQGYLGLEEMFLAIRAMFSSCGEIGKEVVEKLSYSGEDSILVDSPEIGQDMAGLEVLLKGFHRLATRGKQVIIATHHPYFLQGANLISLTPGYLQKLFEFERKLLADINPNFS